MTNLGRFYTGFTLVELLSVVVVMSALFVLVAPRFSDASLSQVQRGRDDVIAAFFSAQQLAMTRSSGVRLSTTTNTVDIRLDANGNGNFADDTQLILGGITYPISLASGVSLTAATFNFDRLGRTTAQVLTVSKSGVSASVNVSDSGYAY